MSLTVGILGGGQLARMMVLAGAPLGLRFELYDPAADACSGPLAPLTVGAFDDRQALADFAARSMWSPSISRTYLPTVQSSWPTACRSIRRRPRWRWPRTG